MAFTELVWPSWKRAPTPVPARAVEASPIVRATFAQPPVLVRPRKRAFHHPPFRQHLEALEWHQPLPWIANAGFPTDLVPACPRTQITLRDQGLVGWAKEPTAGLTFVLGIPSARKRDFMRNTSRPVSGCTSNPAYVGRMG